MAAIREVIDLLSDDKNSNVEEIISSPAKQPPPHSKKRKPFSPLNGRTLRKAKKMTSTKDRRMIPEPACGSFFSMRITKPHLYFLCTRIRLSHFLLHHHVVLIQQIVTDLVIRQRILKNQVGQAFDATDEVAQLLSSFMQNFIFYQGEPNKNPAGECHTPHDKSWSPSSCQLHTDSKFLLCSDLVPSQYYNHRITYNTPENRKLLGDIISFVEKLTISLVREKEHAFKIHCIRYTRGDGMGKHVDYFGIKLAKNGGHRVHLCISIGEP